MYVRVATTPLIYAVGVSGVDPMYVKNTATTPLIYAVGVSGVDPMYVRTSITREAIGSLVYVPALLTLSVDCARPWIYMRLEQHLPTIRVWPQIEAFADEAATILLDRADATVNPERWLLYQWEWVPFPSVGILPKGGERLKVQLNAGPRSTLWLRVMLGVLEV